MYHNSIPKYGLCREETKEPKKLIKLITLMEKCYIKVYNICRLAILRGFNCKIFMTSKNNSAQEMKLR